MCCLEIRVDVFATATGGCKEVREDWVSGTGLRALIQEDPALLWLKYHGKALGFEEDPKAYSFLEFIGEKGRQFEDKWTREEAPEAEQALDKDAGINGSPSACHHESRFVVGS
jgi:hypothetical protein